MATETLFETRTAASPRRRLFALSDLEGRAWAEDLLEKECR
jgi:hypothetical protein